MATETVVQHIWEAVNEQLAALRQIPTATYRLQFNRTFTFNDARALVDYLDALGVSHMYASPYFQAQPGSMHGYDILNHNALNSAIGTEDEYAALVATLHRNGMGQILDTVPNHMGIGQSGNEYWIDVLENGPSSPYATFFDIDWHPLKQEMSNQVLLPILGAQYGQVLENQELRLAYSSGAFFVRYWETQLPVAPRTYAPILESVLLSLLEDIPAEDDPILEMQSIMTAITHLPPRTETDPAHIAERQREKEIIKRRLNTLAESDDRVLAAIEKTVALYNGVPGDPRSFDRLDELVRAQSYRLAYWRVAAEEINYRRFFDVNELAAIRMEQPQVFEATHQLIMRLIGEGSLNGLRIDHPDGLWDPAGYFQALQRHVVLTIARRSFSGDEEEWPEIEREVLARYDEAVESDPHSLIARPLYIVAEKILGHKEQLPNDWTVDGTSGYDFLNLVNGLFVDSANARTFETIYSTFIRQHTNFYELMLAKKRQVMLVSLVSEVNVLAHQLSRLAERNRYVRDFTLNSLTFALREVIACFPIYRTYIAGDRITSRAQPYIEEAVRCARRRNPVTDPSIFDFIHDVLLLRHPESADEEYQRVQQDWVQKFQQVTGPVMAKGLEDTAFYIYNRLISLNEVGGEPQQFGVGVDEFHRANIERMKRWPHTMLTSSTHDTKRSEDVRARINVLSEMPREWRSALSRWSRLNRRAKTRVEGRQAPDRNEEYLLYQTLIGALPFEWLAADSSSAANDGAGSAIAAIDQAAWDTFVGRIQAYMQKAMREAKQNTSWVKPNEPWDNAVSEFVARVLDRSPGNAFLADLLAFTAPIARIGAYNSLAQTLLKLTAPGLPDIYQGNEMWDLSLVDPDNRRPVDYARRRRALKRLQTPRKNPARLVRSLTDDLWSGEIKLYLTMCTLRLRREQPELFADGAYVPLEASGTHARNIVAFARRLDEREVIVVVPRLIGQLLRDGAAAPIGEVWGDDRLILEVPAGTAYTHLFTDETLEALDRDGTIGIDLAALFADSPVAVLIRSA